MEQVGHILCESRTVLMVWSSYQVDIAKRAIFVDDARNTFSVRCTLVSPVQGVSATDPQAHDYDQPISSRLDPSSIQVEALRWIGGVDISYRKDGDGGDAIAALVVLAYPTMIVSLTSRSFPELNRRSQLKHKFLRRVRVTNPYISEYLAMRELAPVLEVYDGAMASLPMDERPQVVFVDGHGRWHGREAGLATAFGVERDVPTIGIAKEYHALRHDISE